MANGFYDLKDLKIESITAMFQDYYDQRFELAKAMVIQSHHATRILGGQVCFFLCLPPILCSNKTCATHLPPIFSYTSRRGQTGSSDGSCLTWSLNHSTEEPTQSDASTGLRPPSYPSFPIWAMERSSLKNRPGDTRRSRSRSSSSSTRRHNLLRLFEMGRVHPIRIKKKVRTDRSLSPTARLV